MNMLANIKALLFTTPGASTARGAGISPVPVPFDFAKLMNVAAPVSSAVMPTPSATTPVPGVVTAPMAAGPIMARETDSETDNVTPVTVPSDIDDSMSILLSTNSADEPDPAPVAALSSPPLAPPMPVPTAPVEATISARAVRAAPQRETSLRQEPVAPDRPALEDAAKQADDLEPPALLPDASLVAATIPAASLPTGAQIAAVQPAQVESASLPAATLLPAAAQTPVQPSVQPSAPTPARAEAVALLQLARDHLAGRVMSRPKADGLSPVRATSGTDMATPLSAAPPGDSAVTPSVMTPTIQPAAMAPVAPAAPVIDLSASLGAQMVDMGVSGQWIDSLARDIAGLSANGAQGRFHLATDQLGAIQVDLRQSDAGLAISLTVETQAAEAALRQDSDRLRLDAGLAALRISDVKIERAPVSTDPARSETAGQQPPNQQQSSSQGQSLGQGAPQQQGRWQARGNFATTHKASGDAAVINHGPSGDAPGEPVRARYA